MLRRKAEVVKAFSYVLVACLALAVLRAVAAALAIAVCLAVVVEALTRPAETLGLLAFLIIANLLHTHPLACMGALTLASLAAISGSKRT